MFKICISIAKIEAYCIFMAVLRALWVSYWVYGLS